MSGARVVSVGHYQPERVLTNAELSDRLDTSDEWIRRRVGIAERRVAAPNESVADMAIPAARRALEASGLSIGDIDLIVVATCTNHDRSPNTAAVVAAALGAQSPAVLDVKRRVFGLLSCPGGGRSRHRGR